MSGLMSGEWKRSARQAIQAPATERAGHPLRSGLNTTAPLLDSTNCSARGEAVGFAASAAQFEP
jgi:hypothetical protein